MAIKRIELADIGTVTLQKRRGNRSMRISINARGAIKITLPPWAPFRLAEDYARSKEAWIRKHRPTPQVISDKVRVGKAHFLTFQINPNLTSPRGTVSANQIKISLPTGVSPTSNTAQSAAERAATRVLKLEASRLLPPRLAQLASYHNFYYASVTIKRLSSRWGSCDSHGHITLNCYLMQLPWQLIDYVLLHELTHTRIMAHGEPFWTELGRYVPNLTDVRKQMRNTRPLLNF
jgi:predicted metal-dependent hydrolase